MSKFLHHAPCPDCGSEDNLAVYEDGEHCFSEGCRYHTGSLVTLMTDKKPEKLRAITPLSKKEMPGMKDRGIDADTINRYRVSISTNPDNPIEAIFPRFNEDGEHIANQVRLTGKDFYAEGPIGTSLMFGQTLFPSGGRSITITEGYYDAMAAYQLTGSRYPNVGVLSASSAKKEFVNQFEYINSFEKIVINFDNDEPGQKAAKEVAQLFAPGKVAILKLELKKDANEYLMAGLNKEFVNEWFRAPVFMPDGLLLGSDHSLLEEIVNYKEADSVPYPFEGLNHKTFGIRTSELVLLTADTGVGKTSVCKEIEYKLLMDPKLQAEGAGVGFLHLEEPKRDIAVGLMSIHNNKPYHFPDVERTEDELRAAYSAVLDTNRVVIWDHFGSNDINTVLAKIRHMAALGCRYIMVDHLSIIVSDQSGDERKQLDEISTKIKTLTMNLDIAVFCVIHTNRQGQVRGSAGPEQVANIILRLQRDIKETNEWRRNITRISVEKNRKFGRTGPASYLYYNEKTGRLEELDTALVQEYETGGSAIGNEFEMYAK